MAKKKKIEICSTCDKEQCICETQLNVVNMEELADQIVEELIPVVIEKTDKQIKVEYYLNHFLKPGWEKERIINSSMINTLGFKDRKFNNTFRKEYTNLTGLTSAGCECLKTYIRLLQKLLNMYNEK
jgi:hypothetical protein